MHLPDFMMDLMETVRMVEAKEDEYHALPTEAVTSGQLGSLGVKKSEASLSIERFIRTFIQRRRSRYFRMDSPNVARPDRKLVIDSTGHGQ